MKELKLLVLDIHDLTEHEISMVSESVNDTLASLRESIKSILVGVTLKSPDPAFIIDDGVFEGKIPFYIKSIRIEHDVIKGKPVIIFIGAIVPIGEIGEIIIAESYGRGRKYPLFIPRYPVSLCGIQSWALNLHFTTDEMIDIDNYKVSFITKVKILKYFKSIKPKLKSV